MMRSFDRTTGRNWNIVGIRPDVATSPEHALDAAYVAALKKVLPGIKDEDDRKSAQKALSRAETGKTAKPDYSRLPE